jgi:hypothetical protein
MILSLSEESVAEPADRAAVRSEYDEVLAAAARVESQAPQPTNR